MKYKYEFEAVDGFEPGCCHECPFSYIDCGNGCDPVFVLYCRHNECPLQSVDEENLKHSDSGKVIKEYF